MSNMWQSICCLHTSIGVALALTLTVTFNFDEDPLYKDISCMVGNNMTRSRDSLVSCAALCVFTTNCKGAFYNNMTSECRLQLVISTPGHACKQENGSHYHYITTVIPLEPHTFTSSDVARLENDETVDDVCRSYPYKRLNEGVKDGHIECNYIPCCLSEGCVSGNGQNYTGTWSITQGGILCQMWRDQFPHRHTYHKQDFHEWYKGDAINYCRNPGDDDSPWCYTIDPDVRWDWCDVPEC